MKTLLFELVRKGEAPQRIGIAKKEIKLWRKSARDHLADPKLSKILEKKFGCSDPSMYFIEFARQEIAGAKAGQLSIRDAMHAACTAMFMAEVVSEGIREVFVNALSRFDEYAHIKLMCSYDMEPDESDEYTVCWAIVGGNVQPPGAERLST
jgi:hypothetical protein